jgi:hypothetical protein
MLQVPRVGGVMGDVPKKLDAIRRTRAEVLADERKWVLNPETGELVPEPLPEERPEDRPRPVPVAVQTFD